MALHADSRYILHTTQCVIESQQKSPNRKILSLLLDSISHVLSIDWRQMSTWSFLGDNSEPALCIFILSILFGKLTETRRNFRSII